MGRQRKKQLDRAGELLEERRGEMGMTQHEIAALAGIDKGSYSHVVNGERRRRETIDKILLAMGMSYDVVFLGMDAIATENMEIAHAVIGDKKIPLIGYADAGEFTEIVDLYQPGDGEEWLFTDGCFSAHTFALEIRGNSMAPEFSPGDRVIIDPDIPPGPGDYVVAKNGGGQTFKRYKSRGIDKEGKPMFDLEPLNDDFETIRSTDYNIEIIGTMIEHRKYRRRK